MESVKAKLEQEDFNEENFFQEFHKELKQIEKEELDQLYKALDCLTGYSVVIESLNGLMIYRPLGNFTYNLTQNKNEEILLDFENEDEEFTCGVTIKLKDIQNIVIDDNINFIEKGYITKYEVESITLTLWNDSILRLSLEW